MITISSTAMQEMLKDSVDSFPDECCGFLFGHDLNDEREILQVQSVINAKEGDKKRRFIISAKDYLKAEQFADTNKLDLIGVYHSHPNHSAIPSEHDRVAAQPFFSYIILSVVDGKYDHSRSWQLDDQSQFKEETISNHHLI